MTLTFHGEAGVLTGDGWIEYGGDKFPDVEVRRTRPARERRSLTRAFAGVGEGGPAGAR